MNAREQCAFTSGWSTASGEARSSCAGAAQARVFIGCRSCVPGIVTWRCTRCYQKLRTGIVKRLRTLETASTKAVLQPEVQALLDTEWRALALGAESSPSPLLQIDEELQAWCWRNTCPCCYDFKVTALRPCMPRHFGDLRPHVMSDVVLDVRAPRLHPSTGAFQSASSCRVRVVTVAAVISRDEALGALYRLADAEEHRNYRILWQPPPPADDGRPRWLLVRGVAPGEEPKLLSCIEFDVFAGVTSSRRDHESGAALLDCTRRAAAWHKCGKTKAHLMAESTVETCVRVNRVSGPFGHLAPGTTFAASRSMACSPRVTGAIPRTPVATVAIPLQRTRDNAITGIAPFYVSVASGLNAPAVTPRHHGIPRRGWVAPGYRLFEEAVAKQQQQPEVLQYLRRFTATTYNGALLAKVLSDEYDLPASDEAVQITVRNMERHLHHFNGGPQTAAYNTRSNQLLPFVADARVFIRVSADGEWFPGQVARAHRDGTVAVRYDDDTLQQADPNVAHKTLSDVRADVAGSSSATPSLTRATSDPEEDVDTSTAQVAEFMAHVGAQCPTAIRIQALA